MYIETKIVSGTVSNIDDNVIVLDGDSRYYPGGSPLASDIRVNTAVSLRYYTAADGKQMYVEVKKGLNSLEQASPPGERRSPGEK